MLDANIIRRSRSPWGSPALFVPKKDGSMRFCINYIKLNKITTTDHFPLPRIDEILRRLSNSVYYSLLDLKNGFWQIKINPNDVPKTAFVLPFGIFEYLKLPFGLKNAPSEFSRIMYRLLGDLPFVEIYIDDITVHSKTADLHFQHLEIIFERLKKANLKLNPAKCVWFKKEVDVLGHSVSQKGIKMNCEKVKSIKLFPTPKCVKDIQCFLGLSGYYRRFVKDYSKHAKPLTNLLEKKFTNKFNWNSDCQAAFDFLKNRLTEEPILAHFDETKLCTIYTDASGYAVGAILAQKSESGDHVVAYASRTLNQAEKNYSTSEKECVAVIFGIKKFRCYIASQHFKVVSDHIALLSLLNIKEPHGKLMRWGLFLQGFDFEIIFRKGKAHTNVDALSRFIAVNTDDDKNLVTSNITTLVLIADQNSLNEEKDENTINIESSIETSKDI